MDAEALAFRQSVGQIRRNDADMTEDKELQLYKESLKRYGDGCMTVLFAEEFSELIKACTKMFRVSCDSENPQKQAEAKHNLIEEIADARIMTEQIKVMWNISEEEIQNEKEKKLNRLEKRLINGNK